jgi:hypothetical protein
LGENLPKIRTKVRRTWHFTILWSQMQCNIPMRLQRNECQTIITFITNSSNKLPWLPTDFISFRWWVKYITICSQLRSNPYTYAVSWVFQKCQDSSHDFG